MSTVKTLAAPAGKPTNGSTAEPQKTTITAPQANQLPPVKMEFPKKEGKENDLAPLDDRLHRLNQLFDLQAKHTRLLQSELKLKNFSLKKEEGSLEIVITDSDRNRFATSNPEVIAACVEFLKKTIVEKRKQVEPLLHW